MRPDPGVVNSFVGAVLNAALVRIPNPEWLSVPQLTYVDGVERNKINKLLAGSTQRWKAKANFKGKLILPIILTNEPQLNRKTERNSKIALATACVEASGADGVWVVDSSLNDQDATGNFETIGFPGVAEFHQELIAAIPELKISIAGPYWALNLLVGTWTRFLCRSWSREGHSLSRTGRLADAGRNANRCSSTSPACDAEA